ncbi:MAG TPA: peptide MFS transporter [Rhizomicrobium sp.]|jgi:POT family proton-dependent oligopeptide transporter
MSRDLFGHPRGLTYLFGTDMWERFSYYGMRALLIYYLTKYVLLPGHVEHVLFYPAIKAFYEGISGPLNVQQISSLIYGTYTGLVYGTPLIGGWIADRYIGQRRAVMIGIVLMALGHFAMASERLLFVALLLLIVGSGFFKTNTMAQVGMLYGPADSRRDRAYSVYYVGTNLGALLAPLVAGTLGEKVGWHYGFGAAGVGMMIALAVYVKGWRYLPPERIEREKKQEFEPLNRQEWKAVGALILLAIPLTLYWACYEQQGNTFALWVSDHADRTLIPGLIDWQIPATWFQSIGSLMIFVFTPFLIALWTRQASHGREASSMVKMIYGCAMQAASYLILAFAAWYAGGMNASWIWTLPYFVIYTLGELYLSPISNSLYSKIAPLRVTSLMMAVNFAPNFLGGGFLQGWLGTYWSGMSAPAFFLMIAGVSVISGVMIWAMERPLRDLLNDRA